MDSYKAAVDSMIDDIQKFFTSGKLLKYPKFNDYFVISYAECNEMHEKLMSLISANPNSKDLAIDCFFASFYLLDNLTNKIYSFNNFCDENPNSTHAIRNLVQEFKDADHALIPTISCPIKKEIRNYKFAQESMYPQLIDPRPYSVIANVTDVDEFNKAYDEMVAAAKR